MVSSVIRESRSCSEDTHLLLDLLTTNWTVGRFTWPRSVVLHDGRMLCTAPLAHDKMSTGKTSSIRSLGVANLAVQLESHVDILLGLGASRIFSIETTFNMIFVL
jgi:hypothetical protein